MYMLKATTQQRAAIDAEVARERATLVGRVQARLPERPILSNDPVVEARRKAEYDAFRDRCAAEAAVWNAEATRWHAERASVAAALFRIDASALAQTRGGLVQPWDAGAGAEDDEEASSEEELEGDSSATAVERRAEALSAEMLSCDVGLAASSGLADLAERQLEISSAVTEAHDRVRWLLAVAERRRAIEVVREEQRAAFITRWLKQARKAGADMADQGKADTAEPGSETAAARDISDTDGVGDASEQFVV